MNPLLPVVPAIILGGIGYFLRERIRWWFVPFLVFFVILGYQLFVLLSKFSLPIAQNPSIDARFYANFDDLMPGIVLTSLYFSVLSVIFVLVGMGVEQFLKKHIVSEIVRIVVATYITLLLLQLWVEVFPWTLLAPLRFYYSLR